MIADGRARNERNRNYHCNGRHSRHDKNRSRQRRKQEIRNRLTNGIRYESGRKAGSQNGTNLIFRVEYRRLRWRQHNVLYSNTLNPVLAGSLSITLVSYSVGSTVSCSLFPSLTVPVLIVSWVPSVAVVVPVPLVPSPPVGYLPIPPRSHRSETLVRRHAPVYRKPCGR